MTLPVLIDVEELSALIEAGAAPRLLDVRWALGDSNGEQHFRDGHIPGAVFVNLDEELASPPSPGKGRHPLPSLEDLQAAARRWGIDDGDSVVLTTPPATRPLLVVGGCCGGPDSRMSDCSTAGCRPGSPQDCRWRPVSASPSARAT